MRSLVLIAATVVFLLAALGVPRSSGETTEKDRQLVGALIVIEGLVAADGVGEMKAFCITGREKLSALENFFPDYRKRPSSRRAAGWKAGYRVYFDLSDGETVRIAVSENENAAYWSCGKGDFETNGDFKVFVAGLQASDPDKPQGTK